MHAITPAGEPRLIIPAFEPFYAWGRDLSYLAIRLTAGGMMLVHGITKLTTTTVTAFAFAAGSLARRGLEPSLPLAYVVFFLETVGATASFSPVHPIVPGHDRRRVSDHRLPRSLASGLWVE